MDYNSFREQKKYGVMVGKVCKYNMYMILGLIVEGQFSRYSYLYWDRAFYGLWTWA